MFSNPLSILAPTRSMREPLPCSCELDREDDLEGRLRADPVQFKQQKLEIQSHRISPPSNFNRKALHSRQIILRTRKRP